MSTPAAPAREFLVVDIERSRCGIDASRVAEVVRAAAVTPVPGAPAYVLGVTSYRGETIPVLDSARRLRLGAGEACASMAIVRGRSGHAGLLVDRLVEIAGGGEAVTDPAPGVLGGDRAAFYEGILRSGGRPIGILSLDEVLDFRLEAGRPELEPAPTASRARARRAPVGAQGVLHLRVRCGEDEYALAADAVVELVEAVGLERPEALPAYVEGFLAYRTRKIPVVDLARRAGASAHGEAPPRTLVITRGAGGLVALAVDEAVALRAVGRDAFAGLPELVGDEADHIESLVVEDPDPRVLAVLDVARLVRREDRDLLERGEVEMTGERTQAPPTGGGGHEVVVFEAGGVVLALSAPQVREALRMPRVTRVPGAPPHVPGVFHHEGRVLPVVDLRVRLGLAGGSAPASRLLVVDHAGQRYGLAVDVLLDLASMDADASAAAAGDAQPVPARFVAAVVARGATRALLLSPEALFDDDRGGE